MSFLDEFLGQSKEVRRDPTTKFALEGNKWDEKTKGLIAEQVREYVIANQQLSDKVETGHEAMSDTLLALFKVVPVLRPQTEMRPSYLVNHKVLEELLKLKEYETAHRVTSGDPVATGMAAAALEPELEILFDKLKTATDSAQKIEQMLTEAEDYSDRIDELMQEAEQSEDEDEIKSYQEQQQQVEENLESLRQQLADEISDLEENLEDHVGDIRGALKQSLETMNSANDSVKDFMGWGMTPGSLSKMNPQARMKLARKLRTPRFQHLADVIGRMQSLAFNEQLERTDASVDEIYELERGADLQHLIPTELLALNDDIMVYDWLHRFVERSLIQYSLHGDDSVVKGGIIVCLDSSSSMSGTRAVWSKAIALALLRIAKMQKRPFAVIEFSGVGSYVAYNFETVKEELSLTVLHKGKSMVLTGPEAVIYFAEAKLGGGTCFMTPLGKAVDLLRDDHTESGSVKGDIVFLTDGQAGVDSNFMRRFKREQEVLGFNVFGIAIGSHPETEPLNTLCDGKVMSLKQLTDINEMAPLFKAVR
jgi:uncharacterized protein with von Willebrand factor type A (vWA) domain